MPYFQGIMNLQAHKHAGRTSGCVHMQVEQQYAKVVAPFLQKHRMPGWPQQGVQQRRLYTWATAIVSSYSFTLGEDRFQGMVSRIFSCMPECLHEHQGVVGLQLTSKRACASFSISC